MGEAGSGATGEVVAAMRAHARVTVVGGAGSGRSTVVAQALVVLDMSWFVVQGLISLRAEGLAAFALAVGARPDEPVPSVVDRVRRRARDGLVVEDVHHLDDASIELLGRLPRWVVTCRADAVDVLERVAPDVVVFLEPLAAEAARGLVRDELGPVADRTVDRVVSGAGGLHRLLREVTSRGTPRTTLRARLTTILAEQPLEVQQDLALLGAASCAATDLAMSPVPTPRELCGAPDATTARGLARETSAGLVADPAALAVLAHELRPGADARHRRLAAAAPDALLTAAHLLLAGDDPCPGLRAAGLLHVDPDGAGLAAQAAVLGRAHDRHPDDDGLVTAAFGAALAVGDVAWARKLATHVADGPARLAAAIDSNTSQPTTAVQRQQDATRRGAIGWRLEAEADLACTAFAEAGPSPAVAARLLALLDDTLLEVSRVRVTATLARTFAWLGRDADARRLLRYLAALDSFDPQVEAEVHWLAGRDHRAAAIEDTVAGAWARVTGGIGAVRDRDDPETSALAWVARDPRRAAIALLRIADDSPTPVVRWRCQFGAVLVLRTAGDVAEAAAALAILEPDLANSHGVALLRRLGPTPGGEGDRGHDDPLTPREREVLVLAGEGLTSREIATHLGITPATVETHVAAGMRKLGAATRLEAVAWLAPA